MATLYRNTSFKMTSLLTAYVAGFLLSSSCLAALSPQASVDLYRTKQITADDLEKRYSKEFNAIAEAVMSSNDFGTKEIMTIVAKNTEIIVKGTEKMGHFAFVNITPVRYPSDPVLHFTVNVVDANDKKRLSHFLPEPKSTIPDPENLIARWAEYEKLGMRLIFEKNPPVMKDCPVYHCIFSFDHPQLKKYLPLFNKAEKNKVALLDILNKDKDDEKRAAAAFLLAHTRDGKQLIRDLIPHIRDSSKAVRNNVMRVLAQAVHIVKPVDFPIQDIIMALDFPTGEDRNKALYVMMSLALEPQYVPYIKQHASEMLLTELKLKQPNVHDQAYQILKKISQKDYAETDYHAWEQWVKTRA